MTEQYSFQIIPYGSEAYQLTVQLRDTILRQPLGLNFSSEELSNESNSFHLGCYLENKLLGCLVLRPLTSTQIQMRQVAVVSTLQGKGIGRALVKYSEQFAEEREYTQMILHARDTALKFYQLLGYTKHGECFLEVSIPHWEMCKTLSTK